MKNEITNCLTLMMNKVYQTIMYESWSDEFKAKEIKESSEIFYEELKKHIDITKLTKEEAKDLRFAKWSNEYPDLYLFPLWIVPLIPEGIEVMDIFGEKFKYEKDKVDNDTRFGYVAYGIEIKE